jgi:hypothetical protein
MSFTSIWPYPFFFIVPHVEQELLILPEHPSFWAIKKLCSFSWTFPENSRRPGGFYFYMMFMIPEDSPQNCLPPQIFRRFKINELIDFIYFDRLCQNIFSKFYHRAL